jgi:hypothetical protein
MATAFLIVWSALALTYFWASEKGGFSRLLDLTVAIVYAIGVVAAIYLIVLTELF